MKPISPDNSTIRPFKTYKAQTLTYISGSGSNPAQLSLSVGAPASVPGTFDPSIAPQNLDGTYVETLYYSVKNAFYNSKSLWDAGAEIVSGSYTGRKFTPGTNGVYVVNISQRAFGETIRPGSFIITNPETSASIVDDGIGHLVVGSTIIGNIFYPLGIAVINRVSGSIPTGSISTSGMLVNGGSSINVGFRATHTIYEYQIVCTMQPSEFNYSFNPTVSNTSKTSPSGSIAGMMLTGSLQPYMTEIGLYNNSNELLAVAKFPRPIKRLANSDQTIIIRFDA